MMITLRPVTRDNYIECCKLEVYQNQREYVAPNVFSLAQSKFEPCTPLAIYRNDTMIGFGLYGVDEKRAQNWIFRFMLGRQYQGKGWGKQAFECFLKEVEKTPGYDKVYLSVNLKNEAAQHVYRSFGFCETGEMADEVEKIMAKPHSAADICKN